jgi:hypothetical protein
MKKEHGGYRIGSGRKKKEPTVVKRLPEKLYNKFLEWLKKDDRD